MELGEFKYTDILKQNRLLADRVDGQRYRVSILTNVTINPLKEILEFSLRSDKINPSIEIGNYDNILQDSATTADSDLVMVFYDALNIVSGNFAFFEDADASDYNTLAIKIKNELGLIFLNLSKNPSVIFNSFSSRGFISSFSFNSKLEDFISEINNYLILNRPDNFVILDIDKIICQLGVNDTFDYRLYHSSKAPYKLSFLKSYVAAIAPIICKNTGKLKKALIFDCDNTLWQGIIGEDGIDNIDMALSSADGRIFNTIQQMAVFLSKRGVIIGLCSKNNEQDVLEVLLNHKDIILKEEHVAIKRINWETKSLNLKSIARELNIGVDSLVFVDDSPFEINLIKEQIPEIVTLAVPPALYEYPNFLLKNIYKYFNLGRTREDAEKTKIYKAQIQRENDKTTFVSIEEYLTSLQIEIEINKDDISAKSRISQLTQKTNQFNLTTLRYTEREIQSFMESEDTNIFSIAVRDKFGESGLTALAFVKRSLENSSAAVFVNFLLSCRIIGRNIEFAIMDYLVECMVKLGYKTVEGSFVETKKNVIVGDFYESLGFKMISRAANDKHYILSLNEYKPKGINYIHVKGLP